MSRVEMCIRAFALFGVLWVSIALILYPRDTKRGRRLSRETLPTKPSSEE